MASASMNRIGGNALLSGGILYLIAVLFHADVSTLALATSANALLWSLVHWVYLAGDVLLVAGLFMLVRHIAANGSASNEGWATIALAAGLMAFTLDAASTGIHLLAFPPAVPANTANIQNVFDAAAAVNTGIGGAGFDLACLGLVVLGTALRREGWSSAVANGAMAVGGLELVLRIIWMVTGSSLIPAGPMLLVVNALMPACYAVIGASFGRLGGAAAAAGAK
jgi:hypothetical protein